LSISVAFVAVSQPFAAIPSQSLKPAAHTSTAHSPFTQASVVTWASAHSIAQPPQFEGSALVSTQLPLQLV